MVVDHTLIIMHHFLGFCIWAMCAAPFPFVSSSELFASEANPVDSLTMHDVIDMSFLENSDVSSFNLHNDNLFNSDPTVPPSNSADNDESDFLDQSAMDSNANNPFLIADNSVNNCLSPPSKFRTIRMRSSAMCTDLGQPQNGGELSLPSLPQAEDITSSPAVANAVDAAVRRRWCSSTSVEGFGNIPVCNVGNSEEFDEDVENSEESALRAAREQIDFSVVAKSPFRNILSGYLSEFLPPPFFLRLHKREFFSSC